MLSSVANALRVLDLLAERGEMGVSEVGRELDLTTATAHRLVTTLVGSGFVDRDPSTRRYRLSTKILVMAGQVRSRIGLPDILRPILQDIARRTTETINLGVYRDGEVVYLDKIDSEALFRIEIRVGAHVPAYCTGLGKAMLAHQDPQEAERYISSTKMKAHTPNTITSAGALRSELESIREQGYAIDRGELLSDVWCVAVPVLADGRPVAAISISAPRSRFEDKQDKLVKVAVRAAEDASAAISQLGALDTRGRS
jgi:DNA-binding IclR family transcriptional regulator